MKALTNHGVIRQLQGFAVYVLANEDVELAVVPELGAKIISLKHLRTGREWMWHPPEGLQLFHNASGADFSQSPLVGMDECLPTIAPCCWQGRTLPDHGEVWNAAWQVNAAAWETGVLKTSVTLKISPFFLERTVELRENEILLSYELTNHSAQAESYLWALHPLLRLVAGDQLELPDSTREGLHGHPWINNLAATTLEGNCAKAFAAPLIEGSAAIHNSATGDRLQFEWNPAENNSLGLWLTRGGWHGHHHFAIEPTNAATDSLAAAVAQKHCGRVDAHSTATWQVCLRVS